MALDREMEVMADNHRVELKVYQQKVKHLEFEHNNSISAVRSSNDGAVEKETDLHLRRETAMRLEKQSLRTQIRATEEANADAIRTMKMLQEKNLLKLRQEFGANLDALRTKFEHRLSVLRNDLTLRHRVEVHEVEERKHAHINQLIKAHDEAFAEIKKYYNDITKANLELIQTLKVRRTAWWSLLCRISLYNRHCAPLWYRPSPFLALLSLSLHVLAGTNSRGE